MTDQATVLPPNVTKERLRAGKVALGVGLRMARTVDMVRAAASSGYHFFVLDLEHSTIPTDVAAQFCTAALDARITSLVRIPSNEAFHAVPLLDAGVQGVIVPHVRTAADAEKAMAYIRYPPFGGRTMGSVVATGWRPMPVSRLAPLMNEHVLTVMLLESWEAIENVETIAAVPGVDVLAVGSSDLTADMGVAGDFDHPRLLEAYAKVVAAAERHGRWVRLGGVYAPDKLKRAVELGSRLVTLDHDTKLMIRALRDRVEEVSSFIDADLLD